MFLKSQLKNLFKDLLVFTAVLRYEAEYDLPKRCKKHDLSNNVKYMNAIKSEELQGKKDNYISKNNTFRELWKALK